MSFIARKIDSLAHRIKTEMFRKSGAWGSHPLNPRRMNLPSTDWEQVHRALSSRFDVIDLPIDVRAYEKFCRDVPVPQLYAIGYKDKKRLEHFLAYTLLDLRPSDIYMDVASEASPYPRLFRERIGLKKVYSQDLSYAPGVRGEEIGSSADAIPLPDRSLTKMSLQCAFEHFEGDADAGFMREAARLLQPGGRCLIVPLYLGATHLNIIDPVSAGTGSIHPDAGSTLIAETSLGGRFERVYSPESLSRILIQGMRITLYRITGHEKIAIDRDDPVYRVRYALLAVPD